MCRDLLLTDVTGIDIVGNRYSFSITDSTGQRVYVYKYYDYIDIQIMKGFEKFEIEMDSILKFNHVILEDSIFIERFRLEKLLTWPEMSDTIVIW